MVILRFDGKIGMRITIHIDYAVGWRLDEIIFDELFEKERFSCLGGSRDEDSGRMPKG